MAGTGRRIGSRGHLDHDRCTSEAPLGPPHPPRKGEAVPIVTTDPRTPGWWLLRLMQKLEKEQSRYNTLDSYYRGLNGIPTLSSKAERESYRRLRAMACSNYPELIVESVVER